MLRNLYEAIEKEEERITSALYDIYDSLFYKDCSESLLSRQDKLMLINLVKEYQYDEDGYYKYPIQATKDFIINYLRRKLGFSTTKSGKRIGAVLSVSNRTYKGTPISCPVAIVTNFSELKEVKKKIENKYGECEISYVSINDLYEINEEDIKEMNLND